MSEIVTCIDFGNSFTKVSFRRSADDTADLYEDEKNQSMGGEERFCYPTAVRLDGQTSGFEENWKPSLFTDFQEPDSQAVGLQALLNSSAFKDLASRFGVPVSEVQHLRQLHTVALALTGGQPAHSSLKPHQSQQSSRGVGIAITFFTQLREKLRVQAEKKFPGWDFDSFPTRLCLPAFGGGPQGTPMEVEQRFRTILEQAGWRVDPETFLISEPVANIIGVLTRGSNRTWQPYQRKGDARRFLHMGLMFDFASLVKAVQRRREQYTVLSCDIGSYTTRG